MAKNFGSDFGPFGSYLGPQFFFARFTSTRCYTLSQSIFAFNFKENLWSKLKKKWQKTLLWTWFRSTGPKFGSPSFFSKIWFCQSLDVMVSYQHVKYQKKLIIQSWENLVTDGRTDQQKDRRTDRQTDESDFMGRCPI